MGFDLTILVGTMTGTAQLVAQAIELGFDGDGPRIEVTPMDGAGASIFSPGTVFLICTSTYGQGDVPDNARHLYESLQTERPDLKGVFYGVIALGDRTYAETFCFGGRKYDALLTELGAKRIGEPMLHDASAGTMPEDVALEWAAHWVELVRRSVPMSA